VDLAAMTRNRAIAAFAAGALLVGCAPDARCGDWCGTIVVVTGAEASTLFPPATTGDIDYSLVDLIFDKLAEIGMGMNSIGDDGFAPALAESWEFEDDRTLRFTIDARARWHDGNPVTARDVEFSFEVYRDSVVNSLVRPRLGHIVSVTARDDRTAVFRFDGPYPEQFYDATHHVWILPKHLLDSIPPERLATHAFGRRPVGSGPYRFVSWSAGASVELAADSAYFRGRPGVPRIIWRVAGDGATALTQVLAGEADVLNQLPRPEDAERVTQAQHLRLVTYPFPAYAYVAFNLHDPVRPDRPHPLFVDRELRRALYMAVDREAVVRAVLGPGGGVVPVGPLSPVLGIWSDTIPGLPFDTAAARAALAGLGWRDRDGDGVLDRNGRRLSFDIVVPTSSTPRVRAAQVIQEQLRRAGVDLTITELEFNAFRERATAGRFDALFSAVGQDPSPSSLVDTWTTEAGRGGLNYGRYSSAAFDRLVAEAQRSLSPERARALWHEALATINADAPAIWIYAPVTRAAVHVRLQNVTLRPDLWSATMWTWTVDPDSLLDRDRLGVR
jgi:peptide/nickel transport system substrate-binding protein